MLFSNKATADKLIMISLSNDNNVALKLLDLSNSSMKKAYSRYSNFQVGAAVLTRNNQEEKIFTGCNIENASYGATICAERVAIFKAVSDGYKEILAVAISVSSAHIVAPCGMCLQVMSEFALDCPIYIQNNDGSQKMETSLKACMPHSIKGLI